MTPARTPSSLEGSGAPSIEPPRPMTPRPFCTRRSERIFCSGCSWSPWCPRVVLDAGAGTGHASRALKRRYPKARVIALDSSRQMLQLAGKQQSWLRPFERVCADAQALPLRDGSVDLIVSNLMLQWCDPDAVFAEFRRVIAPSGPLELQRLRPGHPERIADRMEAGRRTHPRASVHRHA